MWLICEYGFYNVVSQTGDKERGLLTIKARDRRDLEIIRTVIASATRIEESADADYRFRMKAPKEDVVVLMAAITDRIDYPKTKPRIAELYPDRAMIYLDVWSELCSIQDLYEQKKSHID